MSETRLVESLELGFGGYGPLPGEATEESTRWTVGQAHSPQVCGSCGGLIEPGAAVAISRFVYVNSEGARHPCWEMRCLTCVDPNDLRAWRQQWGQDPAAVRAAGAPRLFEARSQVPDWQGRGAALVTWECCERAAPPGAPYPELIWRHGEWAALDDAFRSRLYDLPPGFSRIWTPLFAPREDWEDDCARQGAELAVSWLFSEPELVALLEHLGRVYPDASHQAEEVPVPIADEERLQLHEWGALQDGGYRLDGEPGWPTDGPLAGLRVVGMALVYADLERRGGLRR